MTTQPITPRPASTLRGLHVLLVVADPALSLSIASPLAELGVAVSVARSGSAALGKIADETFDAAIVVDDEAGALEPDVLVVALQRARRPCLTVLMAGADDPDRVRELSGVGAFEVVVGHPAREAFHLTLERCVRATWSLRSTLSALASARAPALRHAGVGTMSFPRAQTRRPPHDVAVRGAQSMSRAKVVDLDGAVDTLAEDGRLSPRERSVLRYIALGYRYRDISDELEISPRTVKMHAANVRRKCGVGTRWELLRRMYGS